jgi:hypothetical protein
LPETPTKYPFTDNQYLSDIIEDDDNDQKGRKLTECMSWLDKFILVRLPSLGECMPAQHSKEDKLVIR